MKYDYLVSLNPDPNGAHFRRPVVDVEIFGPAGSKTTIALLDSGADHCLFNLEWAKAVGINLSNCRTLYTTGVEGGKKEVYLTAVEIRIKHLEKITVPVGFIDSPSVNGLLGQIGFFDLNKIKFERDHDSFEIVPIRK